MSCYYIDIILCCHQSEKMETSSSRVCPCYQSKKKKLPPKEDMKKIWKTLLLLPPKLAVSFISFNSRILFLLVSLSDTGKSKKSRRRRRKKTKSRIRDWDSRDQRYQQARVDKRDLSSRDPLLLLRAVLTTEKYHHDQVKRRFLFHINTLDVSFIFWPNSWRQKIISDTTSHLFFWVNSKFPDAISWRLIHCSRKGRSRHASRYFSKWCIVCVRQLALSQLSGW